MITLIAATDKNGLIGNNGKLPWNIKEDMDFFKKVTMNKIVVMGRKTYISIGKPLKNRINIIISSSIVENYNKNRNLNEYMSDVIVLNSFEDILKNFSDHDLVIIGGRSIYKQSLDQGLPDRLLISKIDDEYDGNEYMPDIPENYKFKQFFRISDSVVVYEYRREK